MSFVPERLELELEELRDQTRAHRQRWSIVLRNSAGRDMYPLRFHPLVPKETADAVLAVLRNDPHLQRILR